MVYIPEVDKSNLGGTMRLGALKTVLWREVCLAAWLYGTWTILERHRHRYKVNPEVVDRLELEDEIRFVGVNTTGKRRLRK